MEEVDLTLVETQKKDAMTLVKAAGFDPAEFEWQTATQDETDRGGYAITFRNTVSVLVHKGTRYFFRFEKHRSKYSPGHQLRTKIRLWDRLIDRDDHVRDWLFHLQLETEQSSLSGENDPGQHADEDPSNVTPAPLMASMANPKHLALLMEGVGKWNRWRSANPTVVPQLIQADLSGADLRKVNLHGANLGGAILSGAILNEAMLAGAILDEADLNGANITEADMRNAHLFKANLSKANLSKATLDKADLRGADLISADLRGAFLIGAELRKAKLHKADFGGAYIVGGDLSEANLSESDLSNACLMEANLSNANMVGANLASADLRSARLQSVKLDEAILSGVMLWETQRAAWSIGGVTCTNARWDKDGREATQYAPGEFESLYSEQPRGIAQAIVGFASPTSRVDRCDIGKPASNPKDASLEQTAQSCEAAAASAEPSSKMQQVRGEPTAPAQVNDRALNARRLRKGDVTLLAGKELVSFETAQKYLGISERQRQSLTKSKALVVEGGGRNRKITTKSLQAYLPPEKPK